MKSAEVTNFEETGRTIFYAVSITVLDNEECHELSLTLEEATDSNTDSTADDITNIEWESEEPKNEKTKDEIEKLAKATALTYSIR